MIVKNKKKVNYPRMISGIRVTDADYAKLKSDAEKTGLKFAEHVRQLLVKGKSVNTDALAAVRKEINKIGVNMNQLAHQANAAGYDDSIYLDAIDTLNELKKKLMEKINAI
jgi:hypothetical protein